MQTISDINCLILKCLFTVILIGAGNGLDRIDGDIKCSGFSTSEVDAVVERSFLSLQANKLPECLKLPLEQVLL